MGIEEESGGVPGPESETHEAGLCGYFLPPQTGPVYPAGRDDGALAGIVKSGKALYVGISNYNAEQTEDAVRMLDTMGIHCLIHQMQMSMIHRENEAVLDVLNRHGVGRSHFHLLHRGY